MNFSLRLLWRRYSRHSAPRRFPDGARLSVWRGARAAVQLVYRADDAAPGMPAQSFTIEADGAPAPAVLRAVELMPSDYPCYESADEHYITKEPGLFPDLLAPLEAPAVTPLPRQYRSVWLSWDIPADAAPGAYEVAVTARAVEEQRMPNGVLYRDADAAGLAFTCRFTLCVGRARLPAQTLLHTEWFHADCLASYYGVAPLSEEHWRILENFIRAAGGGARHQYAAHARVHAAAGHRRKRRTADRAACGRAPRRRGIFLRL